MADKMLLIENEPSINTLGFTRFLTEVVDGKIPFVENESYITNTDLSKLHDRAAVHSKTATTEDIVLMHDNGAWVRVWRSHDDIQLWVASRDRQQIKDVTKWIKTIVPEFKDQNDKIIPVTFWSVSQHGAQSVNRKIEVPKWEEIRDNYESTVRDELDQMMYEFKPSHGGQLLLWEGSPGTGKTYSLRALGDAWRKWAKLHYITDPEEFFGQASYMITVLLQGSQSDYVFYDERDDEEIEKWNVLILEDCGELLSADAKERTGQAVARLLNVVDGMIGQGLKILVLVTTNEPVKKFHPAVTRPGRCAAHIEYKPLEVDRANEWLRKHGCNEEVTKPTTIAELFAKAEGYEIEDAPLARVGFGS